jgi:hypothetical protein
MSIQNMTWNGKQGFQKAPSDDLFIPYHREYSASTIAGSGIQGVTHTERGLTWNEVFLSGHMIPQYAPSVAYRQMEFLLGRIKSLTERSSFTTQPLVIQPQEETALYGNQPKQPKQQGPKKQESPKKQEGPKKQEPPKKPEGPKGLAPPKAPKWPKWPKWAKSPKKQDGPKKPESPKPQAGPKKGQDEDEDNDDDEED